MKKTLSLILSLIMMLSIFTLAVSAAQTNKALTSYPATDERCISLDDAVKAYEEEHDVKLKTYRNYFYVPDGTEAFFDDYETEVPTWYNEYFTNVCIWYNSDMCENAPYPESYCGFSIDKTPFKNVYVADIPVGVTSFLINNGVDNTLEIYKSCNTGGYIGPDHNKSYNESYTNCNNMIYVHNRFDAWSTTHTAYFFGDWYYYYGSGCYGTVKDGISTYDCIRDDHDHTIKSVKEALSEHEALTGEKVETYRYYFLMPNGENGEKCDDEYYPDTFGKFAESWCNEYTDGAGIYWWDAEIADPEYWPGYSMEKSDASDVYYAYVPQDVTTIIFNNMLDGGLNHDAPIYELAAQTVNIPCEYYDPGESDNYPDGTESFDNMIFVVYPTQISINELNSNSTWGGEWYYYYGDGCYGTLKDGNLTNCIRDDHNHSTDSILGDVDGDGTVSVMDATEIQMVLAELKSFVDDSVKTIADYDNDGDISVMDATAIQLKLAELS